MVAYRDLWGTTKRQDLIDSLAVTPFDHQYERADPQPWNKLSFKPRDVTRNYLAWPKLPELAALEPINGLMEKRGGALIDIDKAALTTRMQTYFNAAIDWPALGLIGHSLAKDAARYKAQEARTKALASSSFVAANVTRYIVRPFDVRHAYFTDIRPIWNEPRPQLWAQFSGGNQFLMCRPSGVADPEGAPVFFTRCLGDNDAQRGHSYYIPVTKHVPVQGMLAASAFANLSAPARAWLTHLGLPDPNSDAATAAAPWHHVLAIAYAPQYLGDNADGIAIDWPRIPLPDTRPIFDNSVALGARVAALLDTEVGVPGVTIGTIEDHLRIIGGISNTDLAVKAGWGSKNTTGRVNPGIGKTKFRDWTDIEKDALRSGFATKAIEEAHGLALLGRAVDVYLNDTTFWRGVPEATWDYVIGGYLVVKKWLSYREQAILGRPLTKDEAREVTAMVRRLTALVLLSDQLDANYTACRDTAYAWKNS